MAMKKKPLTGKIVELIQNSDLCTSEYRSLHGISRSDSAYDELFYLYLDSFSQLREIDGYRVDVCQF